MNKTLLCLALMCLAVPAGAATYGPDQHSNSVRLYGYVVQNTAFSGGGGFLTMTVLPANPAGTETVRLEYPDNSSGAADLPSFALQYVVIHAELDSIVGTCVDGPNTFVKPVVVWRWVGTSWEVFDHDCACWLAWP